MSDFFNTNQLMYSYYSLPPPKCANGQYAPDCTRQVGSSIGNREGLFGSRGTKLDLPNCKCVAICSTGKTYYAASHFGKEICLTAAEYQKLKPTEFKAYQQALDQARAQQQQRLSQTNTTSNNLIEIILTFVSDIIAWILGKPMSGTIIN